MKKDWYFKRNCKAIKNSNEEKFVSSAVSFVAGNVRKNEFIVDFRATYHACSNEKYFTSLIPPSGTVKCASKTTNHEINSVGNIIGILSS